MATYSSARVVLAAAFLVSCLTTSLATGIKPVCYTKIQKCCFKFSSCGTIIKKVPKTVDCSFVKCADVCKPRCFFVTKKIPFKVCKKVPKKIRVCKRVKVYIHSKYVWKTFCKSKLIYETVCVKKFRTVKKKVCKKNCRKVCKKVKAICIKIRVLSFPKFCPKLKCYKAAIKGDASEPSVVVGKKSKLIKVVVGKRTIKH